MEWLLAAIEWLRTGSLLAIATVASMICISSYHLVIQKPRNVSFQDTLTRMDKTLVNIGDILNEIRKKVHHTEKDIAFMKGRSKNNEYR